MTTAINQRVNEGKAVQLDDGVYWVGALDPGLRTFDIILSTANGTTYNAYLVQGSEGFAIVDTVKDEYADEFFRRVESVTDYSAIKYIVLNHLEPDHTGALPELLKRAPHAQVYISQRAQSMLKALLKSGLETLNFTPVKTGDSLSLGDVNLKFLNTPFLHWPDTQCTYLVEREILFSGDVFGCHFCDPRLFNDKVGDFRFSFDYYYAHIMRPFKQWVLEALDLIEPLSLKMILPAHGPLLRDRPRRYVAHYRELSTSSLSGELADNEKSLIIFYMSSCAYRCTTCRAARPNLSSI